MNVLSIHLSPLTRKMADNGDEYCLTKEINR